MVPTIQEINTEIRNDRDISDPRRFISLYDHYKEIIENTDITQKEEVEVIVLQLMADYALSLNYIGSFTKAIIYFDKVTPLIGNYELVRKRDPFQVSLYEKLLWNKASALCYIKKFNLAKKEFKVLTAHFPDNDKYWNWLKSTETVKYTRLANLFWVAMMVGLILTIILPKSNRLYLILLNISVACIVCGLIMEGIKLLIKSKNNPASKLKKTTKGI